jgi:hypothetical protein
MKVIFLDIDGVLNSRRYDRERAFGDGNNIDVSRLPLLREIVEQTGARIVLTSTWRVHWDASPALCDEIGKGLTALFAEYGLGLFDKTPVLSASDRAEEVSAWLFSHAKEVEAFVIIDDILAGWGELSDRLVRTSPMIGRGLEQMHVERAIRLLNE